MIHQGCIHVPASSYILQFGAMCWFQDSPVIKYTYTIPDFIVKKLRIFEINFLTLVSMISVTMVMRNGEP